MTPAGTTMAPLRNEPVRLARRRALAKSSRAERHGRFRPKDESSKVQHFVVISGCSGGGKSTLLIELAKRGCASVDEQGRRIVKGELEGEGSVLPCVGGVALA